MQFSDIPIHRLRNLRISQPAFENSANAAAWLGAVQAQEYPAFLWALGLRMTCASGAELEAAFNRGEILRTHLMRPTWHIIARDDIRWMLALTAPRVQSGNAYRYTQLGLDPVTLARTDEIIVRALEYGAPLTRDALRGIIEQSGISAEGQRMPHILMHAELEGLICSAGRIGRQMPYMLISQRAPHAKTLPREQALAELTRRFFTSHAPATARDFAWWSGLTQADMKTGLALLGDALVSEKIEGQTYWFAPVEAVAEPLAPQAHLLPAFDEFTVAFRDERSYMEADFANQHRFEVLSGAVLLNGLVRGHWKAALQPKRAIARLTLFNAPTPIEKDLLRAAAERWAAFFARPLELEGL